MKEQILAALGSLPYGTLFQQPLFFSLLILLVFALVAKAVLLIFSKYLQHVAGKTKTKLDDLIFAHTRRPLFWLILAYGLKLALLNLNINGIITKLVNSAMAIVFVLMLVRIIDVIIESWGASMAVRTKTKIDEVLLPLFHKSLNVLFFIISIIWVLKIWKVDVTPYLAGVGLGGLVLGLALQDVLKNVLGGVALILDKTFQVGDKIKLESGEVGAVYDIGLRSTKIITPDHDVIYVPNGFLSNSRVQNFSRPDPRVRSIVLFSVAYGTDVGRVGKVVLNALQKQPGILKDPSPGVQFLEMGDFALKFRASFWVEKWDQAFDVKIKMTEAIYDALRKAKIDIPYPTQTVHVKK